MYPLLAETLPAGYGTGTMLAVDVAPAGPAWEELVDGTEMVETGVEVTMVETIVVLSDDVGAGPVPAVVYVAGRETDWTEAHSEGETPVGQQTSLMRQKLLDGQPHSFWQQIWPALGL